ncbi:MAG: polysaccharide biosynthesis protein, partial [Candidatus Wildermuthbacteria bacterium]|nr:polysaccharide biosynthesis protein [Candidatus Wildermuthbacteria bacterium]
VVRYGNVVGSRGSVVPFFKKIRNTGKLPITDERMTRFWITLEEGVAFVLCCLEQMKGGEIFIPKIPSTKIIDLADAIAPGIEKKIVGMRPGEKIHEVLVTEHEAAHAREFPDYFVIEPEFPFWKVNGGVEGGRELQENFRYTSDTNKSMLVSEDVRKMIERM